MRFIVVSSGHLLGAGLDRLAHGRGDSGREWVPRGAGTGLVLPAWVWPWPVYEDPGWSRRAGPCWGRR